MGDKTNIQWTDATWNPVRGCSKVSEGCRNCYAEKVAARFSGPGQPYEGLAKDGRWTGNVSVIEDHIEDPLRWNKPRRIFVNSMSDLFHEQVTDTELDRIFAVMAFSKQHIFQILTKRPKRMMDYLNEERMVIHKTSARGTTESTPEVINLPASNIWLGVSVEDQKTADERIPLLLQTPAAVRFISAEPLLGPVDLTKIDLGDHKTRGYGLRRITWDAFSKWEIQSVAGKSLDESGRQHCSQNGQHPSLDWVIIGGESGPGARPFDVAWARWLVSQCQLANVPVFVKQLGSVWAARHRAKVARVTCGRDLSDPKGGDWDLWPEDLRVREFPV